MNQTNEENQMEQMSPQNRRNQKDTSGLEPNVKVDGLTSAENFAEPMTPDEE